MATVNQRNALVAWDDGHDHSNEFVVIRRVDLAKVLDVTDQLVSETVKLAVVSSMVDAVESAIERARDGHHELNEQVLAGLVKTYRKVLNT